MRELDPPMCPSLIFKIAGDKISPIGNCGGLFMPVHKIAFLLGTMREPKLAEPVIADGGTYLGKPILSQHSSYCI